VVRQAPPSGALANKLKKVLFFLELFRFIAFLNYVQQMALRRAQREGNV
jgi:hypothetical protein